MPKRRYSILIILAIIGLGVIISALSHSSNPGLTLLRICMPRTPSSAMFPIANARNEFKNQDLEVQFEFMALGKQCLEQLQAHKVDLAVAYLTPIMHQIARGENIKVITELHRSNRNTSVIYRRASGILGPSDLQGKKLALVPGTNAEDLLRLIMHANGLHGEPIREVRTSIDEISILLEANAVDAAIVWEPILSRLLKKGGDKYGVIESPFYTEMSLLVANAAWLDRHASEVERIIRALQSALIYWNKAPDSAREIVTRSFSLDRHEMSPEIWTKFTLDLGLSSIMKITLAQEMERVLKERLILNPNFSLVDHFYSTALLNVMPESVTYQ